MLEHSRPIPIVSLSLLPQYLQVCHGPAVFRRALHPLLDATLRILLFQFKPECHITLVSLSENPNVLTEPGGAFLTLKLAWTVSLDLAFSSLLSLWGGTTLPYIFTIARVYFSVFVLFFTLFRSFHFHLPFPEAVFCRYNALIGAQL